MKDNKSLFKFNKLCRDILLEKLEQYGSRFIWEKLDDANFDMQLRRKLIEEAEEVVTAQTKQDLIEELADMYEIIDTLVDFHTLSKKEILQVQATKKEQKGGYEGRKFVHRAEHIKGSLAEQYCLQQPDKYPKIEK